MIAGCYMIAERSGGHCDDYLQPKDVNLSRIPLGRKERMENITESKIPGINFLIFFFSNCTKAIFIMSPRIDIYNICIIFMWNFSS